jgi:hypothetical protein
LGFEFEDLGLGLKDVGFNGQWIWARLMKRDNLGEEGRTCNGREERERGREAVEERERKREKRIRWAQQR